MCVEECYGYTEQHSDRSSPDSCPCSWWPKLMAPMQRYSLVDWLVGGSKHEVEFRTNSSSQQLVALIDLVFLLQQEEREGLSGVHLPIFYNFSLKDLSQCREYSAVC